MSRLSEERGSEPTGLAERLRRSERRHGAAVALLRQGQSWLQGQREALEAALNGAPLETSLGILVRTATEAAAGPARAAFYLVGDEGTSLHHVVGMPAEFAEAVDGFAVGPESFSCGLTAATGQPVLTTDVRLEPRWDAWRFLTERFDFRGCWSFPIHTSAGRLIGTLAMYWRTPKEATEGELELASLLTHTASIIISRHAESEARHRAEQVLRDGAAKDRLLRAVSTRMIRSADVQELYDVILDAAVEIMEADFASLQSVRETPRTGRELRLLGHRGFPSEAAAAWECVRPSDTTTCAGALRHGERVVVADLLSYEPMSGTEHLAIYLAAGVRAVQSTPLVSRTGTILGVISTHWRQPHASTDQDLHRLDGLARQAADLMERASSEAALRDSEQRLRALLSATSDVIYRMSADWTELRRLEGRHRMADIAEPSRSWLKTYVHPDDRRSVLDSVRRAIGDKGVFELEHRLILSDGSVGWTHSRAVPIPGDDGEIVEWLGAASDITQRKRAEEELRASEARYRSLFDSIDEGYCVVRVIFDEHSRPCDYVFEEVNAAFERHAGIERPLGRSMREIAPEHEEHWFETYGRIAVTGRPERFESVAEELHRWFDVYAFRIGEPRDRRVAILFTDITERKQADRRKDEFLATLAHELRNPLAPIRTGLELLKRGERDGSSEAETRVMMERQLNHMVRLIDDLLDVSRISRGKVALKRERVELQAVVQGAIDAVRPFIAAHHHEISVRLPAEPVWLDADPTRLDQVLANLLTNAAKYTPDGGRVELAASRAGEDVVITVTDTGAGLRPEQLEAVFELFAQVNRTLDRSQGGLGIGLALVRRLVEMHGGTVTAASEGEGRGSTFTVRLPVAPAPRMPVEVDGGAESGATAGRLRVLVVDDNADAADSLGQVLELSGHDTRTAHDGRSAVEIAERFAPEVVFCDLGMPGMDGYEVARRLRRGPSTRPALLVALTGWGNEADRKRSASAGFDVHLTKPVTLEEVSEVLASAGHVHSEGADARA